MLQIARLAALLLTALGSTACVQMKNPATTAPDNVFYYPGKAQDLAMCWLRAGPVNDRCLESNTLAAAVAEDGNTYLIRCQRTQVIGPGAGAAGAGIMGFIIGQAVDRMAEDSFDPDPARNTVFMAAFRNIAADRVETRLWMTETLILNETRFNDLKASLDSCAGGAPQAAGPESASGLRPLQPTTVAVPDIDPATIGKTETPSGATKTVQPKATAK